MLRPGAQVAPPHLLQNLFPCRLAHAFVHSSHGNSYFWHNVSFLQPLPPLPGNKTFGAIRNPSRSRLSLDFAAIGLMINPTALTPQAAHEIAPLSPGPNCHPLARPLRGLGAYPCPG